jgi:hypothetical protein
MPLSRQMRHGGNERACQTGKSTRSTRAPGSGAAKSCRRESSLSYVQRRELWQIVDFREWCLRMQVRDYPNELERIDREIEHALRRR